MASALARIGVSRLIVTAVDLARVRAALRRRRHDAEHRSCLCHPFALRGRRVGRRSRRCAVGAFLADSEQDSAQ